MVSFLLGWNLFFRGQYRIESSGNDIGPGAPPNPGAAGKRIYLAFQRREALTTSVGLLQSADRRLLPTDNLA